MMTNKRTNRPELDLLRYVPPDHFRTVESFEMAGSPTETPVMLGLKDPFCKKLSFPTPWDGQLCAYFRWTEAFRTLCGEISLMPDAIRMIYLEDWDDKFLLLLESRESKREVGYFVSSEAVAELLENCCRIVSQKRPHSPY